jgi:sucrose-6-phosphate hydrolase SacC (GH32 family)
MIGIESRCHGLSVLSIICFCQSFLFTALTSSAIDLKAATEFEPIRQKTVVVWLSLDNLDQRGVHVFRLANPWGFEPNQNTLSFGDVEPRKWMLLDTPDGMVQRDQSANATETSKPGTLVQIAAVFEDAPGKTPNPIRIYRNGQLYADYATSNTGPLTLESDSLVIFGRRVGFSHFQGFIEDARIYRGVLSPNVITGLTPNRIAKDEPQPAAWWPFNDNQPHDQMGLYPRSRLEGDARITDGKLYLGGRFGNLTAARKLPLAASEERKPTFHFTALREESAFHDVNGSFFWNGRYHMMYIFFDWDMADSSLVWGHASSADLVNWVRHPPSLIHRRGDPDRGIFSGNAFINKKGVPMLQWYGLNAGVCLAEPEDLDDPYLTRWNKHPKNPVIGGGWDPWLGVIDDKYYCIVGGGRNKDGTDTGILHTSDDLLTWKRHGPFYQPRKIWLDPWPGRGLEDLSCPDFFQLGDKWVLMCISHLRGLRAYVGDFDKAAHRFHPEKLVRMNWPGGMLFAGESLKSPDGRRIFWVMIHDPRIGPSQHATQRNSMTLPRVLDIDSDDNLLISPAPELKTLRREHYRVDNVALRDGEVRSFPKLNGDTVELKICIDLGTASRAGVKVLCQPDGSEQTVISYDRAKKVLILDLSQCSQRDDFAYTIPPYTASHSRQPPRENDHRVIEAPLELKQGESLNLRIFIDRCVLEVFANERQSITQMVYPKFDSSVETHLFADGGDAKVISAERWKMAPIRIINKNNYRGPAYWQNNKSPTKRTGR